MDFKTQTIELLELAQTELQVWIASLSEAERREVGTIEKWSAKDLIAHIAAWCADAARSLTDPDPKNLSETGEELDKANADIFLKYHLQSWNEIDRFTEQAYRSMLEQAKAFPLEVFSNTELLPWQDGLPIWRWLIGVGYMHPLIHLAQYDLSKGNVENARKIQENATNTLLKVDPSPKWQGTLHYNLGCFYAQAGETYNAVEALRRAFLLNPELYEYSKKDADLASLRDAPEYLALGYKHE